METVDFDVKTMTQVTKGELMDWWFDLIKQACENFDVWPGQIMNTHKKTPQISAARRWVAGMMRGKVRMSGHGILRKYIIAENGDIPHGWRMCSFPDMGRIITGGHHTTFIAMEKREIKAGPLDTTADNRV